MKLWQKIKNWLIKKLGGFTDIDKRAYADTQTGLEEAVDRWADIAIEAVGIKDNLMKSLVTVQTEIKIDPLFGYTEENVITAAKAQTIRELGSAIYPYVHHFISSDGVYIPSVEVLKETPGDDD